MPAAEAFDTAAASVVPSAVGTASEAFGTAVASVVPSAPGTASEAFGTAAVASDTASEAKPS